MVALLLTALLQTLSALAPTPAPTDYPKQLPIPVQDLNSCRTPDYSEREFLAMTKVVEVTEVRKRFPGSYMFVPAGGGVHPGVIFLHGSGGGRLLAMSCTARVIAANGYAALAFCYFDCGADEIAEALADVDLRRTYDAMVWLKRSPYVGGGKIALIGASRGAEKAALLASLLGHAAVTDKSIVLPNLLYASAPYGRVVGAFNWRASYPDDQRWQQVRRANAHCLRPDPNGPYSLDDGTGGVTMMQWDANSPACADRPALTESECWATDPNGKYSGPRGSRRNWLSHKCAAPPTWDSPFDRPAWTWDLDPPRVRRGADIELHHYPGPILIAHGATDPLWSVENGPDYLRRTLERNGVRTHRKVIPKVKALVTSWPELPQARAQVYIFEDEPHLFSPLATIARRQLFLAFFARHLR